METISKIGSGITAVSTGLSNARDFVGSPYNPSLKVKVAAGVGLGYLAHKFYKTGSLAETAKEGKYVVGALVGLSIKDKISQITENRKLEREIAERVLYEKKRDHEVSTGLNKILGGVEQHIRSRPEFLRPKYPLAENIIKGEDLPLENTPLRNIFIFKHPEIPEEERKMIFPTAYRAFQRIETFDRKERKKIFDAKMALPRFEEYHGIH